MGNPLIYTIIGILLTCTTLLSTVVFRAGQLSQRVVELERWRGTIRQDMHEISNSMLLMATELKKLATVIEERTERRVEPRHYEKENSI
jgi:hypothetical protein